MVLLPVAIVLLMAPYVGEAPARDHGLEKLFDVEPTAASFVAASSQEHRQTDRFHEERLWLARGIFSESKRPEEQKLVAWVVRNRVETGYRGKDRYKDVVLDPYQFSAFNPHSRKRAFYSRLDTSDTIVGWRTALRIAEEVMNAPESSRPFPVETRHFFSERSMPGHITPYWAEGQRPVGLNNLQVDPRRFRFYKDIS